MIIHSKYQTAFFNEVLEGKGDILLKAVAGASKTYCIVEALNYISPTKAVGFFAFNNHIVDELKNRCPSYVDITTLHSYGWRHMHAYFGGTKLNPNKCFQWCEKLLNVRIPKEDRGWYYMTIVKLIDLLRYNVLTRKKDLIDVAIKHNMDYVSEVLIDDALNIFNVMCEDRSCFDFTDMIYIPAIMDDLRLKTYDIGFIDEAQDLSVAQHMLIDRAVKKKGRTIVVGDPNQAIYGFAGSDAMSWKRFEQRAGVTQLPLSVCYRCAKNIVYKAQELVEDIEPFEDSPEGVFRENGKVAQIKKGDWVLCRNVKPLIILYIDLLKNGKRAYIKGEDIGKTIVNLIKQTKSKDMQAVIRKLIDKYKQTKVDLINKGIKNVDKHPKVGHLQEMIAIITFLSEKYKTVDGIESAVGKMFKDKGDGILLSTIHKAKGLENDRVFLICPDLIPSKYAVQPWQQEQEHNLLYVAYTRARKELIIVDDFKDTVEDFLMKARRHKKQLSEELN